MVNREGINIGRILVLIGGVLMIVFALIQLVSMTLRWPLSMHVPRFYLIEYGLVTGLSSIVELVAGVIAVGGSKRADEVMWTIILLVAGLLVGGWGGILVAIGALIAVVARNI